jgi:transcriptional regulator with XRE-family HTH domain
MNHDNIVGQGVRALRQRKGWTLEKLSSHCGLSISFLSQVERGLSSLSISSLHSICEALEVPMTHFFAETSTNGPLVVRAGDPRSRILIGDSHVTYNMLSASFPNRVLEALISEYPPHYSPPLVTHEGEEFGYVLEGNILLQVGNQEETLGPGDSFHIISSQPHTVQNPSAELAKVLWVLTMKLLEGGGHL